MPFEKSAGAVIFRKDLTDGNTYYLLLHYKPGHWDFPKGHVEGRETTKETVRREVEEETGIKNIKIIPGFFQRVKYYFRQYKSKMNPKDREKNKTPWVTKMVDFYLAQTKTEEIKLSFEHTGYKWLDYESALKKATYKNAKEILKKANEFLNQKPA